jgi:phospholipase/carboxylesterase
MTEPLDTERMTDLVSGVLPAVLNTLVALEQTQRHTHPGRFEQLAQMLEPLRDEMSRVTGLLTDAPWPEHLEGFRELLYDATRQTHGSLERCANAHASADPFVEWMRGMRGRTRAMDSLYPMSAAFTPVSRFFLEPDVRENTELVAAIQRGMQTPRAPDAAGVGVMAANNSRKERGGFSLYIPEYYDPEQPIALVVALHGGSGHGADFLWTWLREARSRGFAVLCPTAQGGTWSLMGDDVDAEPLRQMVEYVSTHWSIDSERVLLTGMSDGGTYTSLLGLGEGMPFTALAPLCGVFHPMNEVNGNMARLGGTRIYLLHGALDWMFPVDTARVTYEQLLAGGADVTYREVPDLSHTYPRDENDAILRWFDSSLSSALVPSQ